MQFKTDILEKRAILQRDRETYAVVPHIPGGIITDFNFLHTIADIAQRYGAKALKITTSQRIAIIGVKQEDIDKIWKELGLDKGAATGLCVRSVRICPATQYCKFAQQDAVSLGVELDKLYHGMSLPSKLKIAVCGCMNSCTEPAVKDIGIMGTPKGFSIMIGGNAGIKPRMADMLIEHVPLSEVAKIVARVISYYQQHAKKFERLGKMIDRLGWDNVKKDLLD